MKIEQYLIETDKKHSDFVDAIAYAIAGRMIKMRDEYLLLYVKSKPWFIPEFIYKWILKKLLVIAEFKK